MKNRLFAFLLVLVITLSAFTSCGLIYGDVDRIGSFTVVVENTDGTYEEFTTRLEFLSNYKEGAKGVLEHLDSKEEGLKLDMIDSTYGAYVSGIGSIRESNADKMYVIVYTTVAADSYEGAPTFQYKDTTLYQAGVGLSAMKVKDGGIILFRLEKSPY